MIKIIVLLIILYICVRSCYLFYKKNYEEQEIRILRLEQRLEEYKRNFNKELKNINKIIKEGENK